MEYCLFDLKEHKTYSSIPETYKIQWQSFEKFLPKYYLLAFNQRVYYNLIQRECFNSCISNADSSVVDESERNCFNNCRNKHLSSLAIYESVSVNSRKWEQFLPYVNLTEYAKPPEKMGKLTPTDPLLIIQEQKQAEDKIYEFNTNGLSNVFGVKKPSDSPTLMDLWMAELYPKFSKAYTNKTNPTFTPDAEPYNMGRSNKI